MPAREARGLSSSGFNLQGYPLLRGAATIDRDGARRGVLLD
jgi:hypothetical protein